MDYNLQASYVEVRNVLKNIHLLLMKQELIQQAIKYGASSIIINDLKNITIQFKEYNRSTAEKAGGPYEGLGIKRILGSTTTDSFGNYIFRFQMANKDIADEILNDYLTGEDVTVQMRPDLLVCIPNMIPENPPVSA